MAGEDELLVIVQETGHLICILLAKALFWTNASFRKHRYRAKIPRMIALIPICRLSHYALKSSLR